MSLSEDLREFAGVVELLEHHGVEVQGARSIQTSVDGDLVRGEITVLVATDTEISVDEGSDAPRDVECPDCDRTFDDIRAMKNHHARSHEGRGLEVGDEEFWCGICQEGPMTDHGLKSHHGHMHEGGDLQAVTDPPDEWLDQDDDEVPPHHDPERLEEAYEVADGVIADTADQLDVDVTTGAVRYQLIQHGIHDPDGDSSDDQDDVDDEIDVNEPEKSIEELDAELDQIGPDDVNDEASLEANGAGQDADGAGALLDAHGVSEADLIDAIAGAQTIHQVQRELNVGRDAATELISSVGLLEKLSTGCPPVDESEARRAVREGVRS